MNRLLVDYSFSDEAFPDSMSETYRCYIEDMRERLEKLDEAVDEYESENDKCSLDKVLVRAVFYCLTFGDKAEIEYTDFVECFDGRSTNDLDSVLEDIKDEIPEIYVSPNHSEVIVNIYNHLKGI